MHVRPLHALGLLAASSLGGCGGVVSSAPADSRGDFRSAALSVTPAGCLPPEVANSHAYELAWSHDDQRLTVDLYGVAGVGCADLQGGALVDDIANTLFLFFDAKTCDQSCGAMQSHVQLRVSDDMHGLTNSASVVVTSAWRDENAQLRPDLANVIVSQAAFFTRSDYVQYIPAVQAASVTESSPGKSVLSVRWADAGCQGSSGNLQLRPRLLVPYALRPFAPQTCVTVPAAQYFFDSSPADSAPLLVLSKAPDGTFSLVQATP
jgi:hypothetical protein